MRILGRERWDIFALRSHLGIVSPDLLASCTTDSTGRDVVLSGFFSSTRIFPHHHPDARHLARADDALAQLGMVHEPNTLLFDEPSSALDIAAQFQLRETMRDLARSGLAILLVTHHVSEIIPEMERVILLRDGRVLADGRKEQVLTAENLQTLFRIEVRLQRSGGFFHLY